MDSSLRNLGWSDLPALFPRFPRPERWLPAFRLHRLLVAEWNARADLTSVSEEAMIHRNYAESMEIWALALSEVLPDGRDIAAVADIGSGGGFPGMIGAVLTPRVGVHLIESRGRRAGFLALSRRKLDLPNVTISGARVEDVGRGELRGYHDLVVARAVASLATLLEYAAPILRPGGAAVLPKGSSVSAEVAGARSAAATLGFQFRGLRSMRPAVSATPFLASYVKVRDTPPNFPRRAGMARKHPLG